jgi:hypothetical protein
MAARRQARTRSRSLHELIARYPVEGSALAPGRRQMFESIVQFGDAARYCELYVEQFPNGEKRSDALYNAVVLQPPQAATISGA